MPSLSSIDGMAEETNTTSPPTAPKRSSLALEAHQKCILACRWTKTTELPSDSP